jgi:flagellar basal-body rod protein FlgC
MINAIGIALSGLAAATNRLNTTASNIANLTTVGSLAEGGQRPYTPLTTTQQTTTDSNGNPIGVSSQVVPRSNPFVPVFSPDSPFADENGIIGAPNINLAEEAVNLLVTKNVFKANVASLQTAKEMSDELLSIFDKKV